ncbi:hypothetical protein I4F81_010055 [Pyropia yezoensis]|uniref:Uncharacterized protein n=1 Tax=Pyropia yezoensis TaxID=2788 RepID=A0ACC3CC82_PYRYE|nr:hypothetical protein I4F81_010055 [Neopyropia yezoensis]
MAVRADRRWAGDDNQLGGVAAKGHLRRRRAVKRLLAALLVDSRRLLTRLLHAPRDTGGAGGDARRALHHDRRSGAVHRRHHLDGDDAGGRHGLLGARHRARHRRLHILDARPRHGHCLGARA